MSVKRKMISKIKKVIEIKSKMADTTLSSERLISLVCVAEGSRLRVKIEDKEYYGKANCQFPKDLRAVGKRYQVPSSAITFARGAGGTVFYRVDKKRITVLDAPIHTSREVLKNTTVYEDELDEECVVCMAEKKDIVFIPCGHFYRVGNDNVGFGELQKSFCNLLFRLQNEF